MLFSFAISELLIDWDWFMMMIINIVDLVVNIMRLITVSYCIRFHLLNQICDSNFNDFIKH